MQGIAMHTQITSECIIGSITKKKQKLVEVLLRKMFCYISE